MGRIVFCVQLYITLDMVRESGTAIQDWTDQVLLLTSYNCAGAIDVTIRPQNDLDTRGWSQTLYHYVCVGEGIVSVLDWWKEMRPERDTICYTARCRDRPNPAMSIIPSLEWSRQPCQTSRIIAPLIVNDGKYFFSFEPFFFQLATCDDESFNLNLYIYHRRPSNYNCTTQFRLTWQIKKKGKNDRHG